MAVLHEYVSSSENEGYYIYAAHNQSNITYQVSSLARNILEKLDSCVVDEQLPSEVFYTLKQAGLIYTHQSGVDESSGFHEIPTNGHAKRLSPSERDLLYGSVLTNAELDKQERKELLKYIDNNDIEPAVQSSTVGDWIPAKPDGDVHRGTVKKTFQRDEWGFIESAELDDDVFFHISELNNIALVPGMPVDFTYKQTSEGYEITHIKQLTDALGQSLDSSEADRTNTEDESDSSRDDGTVGIKDISEGAYVEAKIDHASGKKGIGTKGYLHILYERGGGTDYRHIGTSEVVPVGKWVVVRIMSIQEGYAEAIMEAPPENVDPPIYMP